MNHSVVETEVLVRAVRSFLSGRPDEALPALVEGADRRRVLELARQNKLGVMLWTGVRASLETPPSELRTGGEAYRAATIQKNASNLTTLRHAVPLLEQQGVRIVVLKGPAHQQLIYGNCFTKPAIDVDFLVMRRDYARAAGILQAHGYELPPACDTPWWRDFLGEQPFLSGDRARVTIDLHHRTQQPGCPAAHDDDFFMADSQRINVAGVSLPILGRSKATLLSCMNVAKAMFHREPAGSYVLDVAAALHAAEPGFVDDLLRQAGRQGLRNTVELGFRCAAALLGVRVPLPAGAAGPLSGATEDELIRLTFAVDAEAADWPKRRRMLWDLCDSKWSYPGEATWALSGELVRRLFQSGPLPPPDAAARSTGA